MIHKSYDTETTGLDPYADTEMFAYCIGDTRGGVEVRRFDNRDTEKNNEAVAELEAYFDDTSISKICHNYKFELAFTKKFGIHIPEETVWHDTMIMSQLLNNLAVSHRLDRLAYDLCEYERDLDIKVKQLGDTLGSYQKIPIPLMTEYQKADGERTMILFKTFYPLIKEDPDLYEDYLNEIALVKVTQRLEEYGIMLARKETDELLRWLGNELEKVQDDGYRLLKEYVNLSSGDVVINLLYKRFNYPILAFTETKKPSTEKDVLLKLRDRYPDNPIFDLIFKQRSYTTASSIIQGYKKFAGKSGIIHPNVKQNHARTGRQASDNPNLQNVSKEEAIKNPFPVPARRCFRCRPGCILFFPDYIGIEIRLIIGATGEPEMIEILKSGGDPHWIASEIFYGVRFKNASPKEKKILRAAAKNAHFALAYGAALAKVAVTLGMSVTETKAGYYEYRDRFPKIAGFTRKIANDVKKCGYVQSPFGRKLYIEPGKEFTGSNYLTQHTAAIILKHGEVKVDRYCKTVLNDMVRIVVPIHDELVLSFNRKLLNRKIPILRKIGRLMVDVPKIQVPLDIEWKMSKTTWDKAEEIEV